VGLIARGQTGLDAAAADVRSHRVRALTIPADVADAAAIEDAADRVERELGPIDVWVNNAMVSVFSPVTEMTAAEFRRVTEVTYLGAVHGTLAALRRMHPRDCGTIVQVGSALAYRGIPLQAAYCAAKHAIQGFCDSLRTELLHEGSHVRLSMVQLPALNTPQFSWVKSRLPNKAQPVPPVFQPEVAAAAIVFAATHNRREMWVGGPTVSALLGNKVAPGLLDRYLAETGYEAQQTDEPEDADRPHNLWTSLNEDRGAHGAFDAHARRRSIQLWFDTHRWASAAFAAIAVGLAGMAAYNSHRSP
jgi:NAD(P)-dependent dehydrogenase (short-subunit alcohol dehydrogenase family)